MKLNSMVIKEVAGNLYNLNDLHKASGGDDKHKPSQFMRNQQTIDLANEIAKRCEFAPFRKVAGRTGGTYACKELVYAYAMWISPEFHLKVINCFDAVVSKNPVLLSSLDRINSEVKRSTAELMAVVNESSATIADLKKHGSDWGAYGAAIRKVKLEATKQLNAVKAELQLKLDLLG